MAKIVLTDAYVTVNSADLSDHVRSVELDLGIDAVEQTTMGDSARNYLPGLKTQTINITFANNYAAGKVDATITPLIEDGTAFTVLIKPVNAAVSATNPSYSGTAICTGSNPSSGSVGDLHEVTVNFQPGDGAGFARATS